jgi:hypothetical protein
MTKRKAITAKRCTVCGHPDRVLIESTHVAGASLDAIGNKYGVSRDAVHRHCRNHLPDELRAEYLAAIPLKELAAKAADEGVSVLEHFRIVRSVLMTQFQLAASVHDKHATAQLAGRLTEVLRAMGQITGEMGNLAANSITIHNTTIMNSPVFASLQANLLQALAPFPDARAAVVTALRQMEEQNAPPMKTIEHLPVAESATKRVVDHVGPA